MTDRAWTWLLVVVFGLIALVLAIVFLQYAQPGKTP